MDIEELAVYRMARKLSHAAWKLYRQFDWHDQKLIGDQWITSIDSVGANIAEGFGRFHYLDKVRFYYQARGSLVESKHWTELMGEREKLTPVACDEFLREINDLNFHLNNYIKTTKDQIHR